jgi:hypothetical protein
MLDERLASLRTVAAIGGWAPMALLAVRYRTARAEIADHVFKVVG